MANFPMFMKLEEKHCLVAGGGLVAAQKVETLLDFEGEVWVVAPRLHKQLQKFLEHPSFHWIKETFSLACLQDAVLVVAATDDSQENHRIAMVCQEKKIPVNVVDQPEDCTFFFSSYYKEKNVVAAFSSSGESPVLTQYLRDQYQKNLPENLGDFSSLLGALRPQVKCHLDTLDQRRAFYQELLRLWLEKKELPTEQDIERMLEYGPNETFTTE